MLYYTKNEAFDVALLIMRELTEEGTVRHSDGTKYPRRAVLDHCNWYYGDELCPESIACLNRLAWDASTYRFRDAIQEWRMKMADRNVRHALETDEEVAAVLNRLIESMLVGGGIPGSVTVYGRDFVTDDWLRKHEDNPKLIRTDLATSLEIPGGRCTVGRAVAILRAYRAGV